MFPELIKMIRLIFTHAIRLADLVIRAETPEEAIKSIQDTFEKDKLYTLTYCKTFDESGDKDD